MDPISREEQDRVDQEDAATRRLAKREGRSFLAADTRCRLPQVHEEVLAR